MPLKHVLLGHVEAIPVHLEARRYGQSSTQFYTGPKPVSHRSVERIETVSL